MLQHRAEINTHPVNRIPDTNPRPRKSRISLRPAPCVVPLRPPRGVHLCELGEPAVVIRAPAEVVDDEPPHAGGLGGVDHGGLQGDARRPHGADGGVVSAQGARELGGGVAPGGDLDHGDARGECRGGLGAGDDGYVEAGFDQGCGDGGAEVAGCLWIVERDRVLVYIHLVATTMEV